MKWLQLFALIITILGCVPRSLKKFKAEALTLSNNFKGNSKIRPEKTISLSGSWINTISSSTIRRSTYQRYRYGQDSEKTTTCLNMATPPFIISPMIKRWQAEQNKKNLPMASAEERLGEAPGLRVGAGAWKWPQIWPYDDTFFKPMGSTPTNPAGSITTFLSNGIPSPGAAAGVPPFAEAGQELDVVSYWGEEKSMVTTDIDTDSAELIRRLVVA